MKFAARSVLNKLLWDSRVNRGDYEIVYESRGAPSGVERVSALFLSKVFSRGFEYEVGGRRKYIPFHRIVEIRNVKTGEVLYRSRRHGP